MKKLAILFILVTTMVTAQQHEGNIKIFHNSDKETILKVGGNDKDVLKIGGFLYGVQYETDGLNRHKFSFYGGMYFNTPLKPLKINIDVNYGTVWNNKGAAGLRVGGIGGLEYHIGKFSFFGGLKYDEYNNRIKPLIGGGIKF